MLEGLRRRLSPYLGRLREPLSRVPKPEKPDLVVASVLALSFITAVLLRITPLRYGVYLNEYDPYFQYYMTKWIIERGWSGFIEWFGWHHDPNFWYPMGRDVAKTAYPGVAFMGAFLYLLLSSLGIKVDLVFLVSMVPVIFNSLLTIVVYYLAKEIYGKGAGLFASITVAVSPSMLGRSLFGFYDDDNLAILFIVLAFYGFIKAYKNNSVKWGIVAGLALSYVSMTWGAYIYVLNLLALFVIAVMVLGRYERSIGVAYYVSMGLTLIVISQIPKIQGFVKTAFAALPLTAFVVILFYEFLYLKVKNRARLVLYTLLVLVILGAGFYGLQHIGVIKPIIGKFLVVLDPFYKTGHPWFESVGEHQTSTWYSFFIDFGVLVFFAPLGIYMMLRRGRAEDIFMAVYFATALHAMASLIRLSVLLAPAMAIVGGVGIATLIENYVAQITVKKPRRRYSEQVRQYSGMIVMMIVIILLLSFIGSPFAWRTANQPQSIIAAEAATYNEDWISALLWMKANIPKDAVVASWWDYGYWITVNTGLKSTCDNANFNFTQIQLIGRALMGNETVALKIFKQLNVSYVLVFENFLDLGRYHQNFKGYYLPFRGDFEKSLWMARIGYGYTDEEVRKYYMKQEDVFGIKWTVPTGTKAAETTLYRLLFNKIPGVRERFPPVINIPPPEHFELVFASKPNGYVLIYKVIYPEEN